MRPTSASTSRYLPFRSLSGLDGASLGPDLVAGIMLAAIAIPEQMATAKLGHFAPETGFVVFIAATIAFAAFGASRYMSVGADSTITPIFSAGLILLASSGLPGYAALAPMLALFVGVFVLAAGISRMGWIANLLSLPVTTGFLAGISLHIAISQLPTALGIAPAQGSLLDQALHILRSFDAINPAALAISAGVLSITLLGETFYPRLPAAFAGLVLAVFVGMLFQQRHIAIDTLGVLAPPAVSLNVTMPTGGEILHLMPLALIVSLIVMVQSAATSRSLPSSGAVEPDFNRDLIGVGAANIAAGLLGAFPANASPPRSAVTAASGARTQLCGLVAAGIVALLAAFGSGLLREIPSAALAGVLLFVACRIMRIGTIIDILRQSWGEFVLIAATMLSILLLPIEIGVGIGIVLSLLHGMWMATSTRLIELVNVPDTTVWWPRDKTNTGTALPGIKVVAFQAPLSFINADDLRRGFSDILSDRTLNVVILEASGIADIDFTAAQALKDIIMRCQETHVTFALARLESTRACKSLDQFGVAHILGADHIHRSVDEAVHKTGAARGNALSENEATKP